MTDNLSLIELAADYAKRIGFEHKAGPGARLAYEEDIADALVAFHKEASRLHQAEPEPDNSIEARIAWSRQYGGSAEPVTLYAYRQDIQFMGKNGLHISWSETPPDRCALTEATCLGCVKLVPSSGRNSEPGEDASHG
jgi:hypothetical protein